MPLNHSLPIQFQFNWYKSMIITFIDDYRQYTLAHSHTHTHTHSSIQLNAMTNENWFIRQLFNSKICEIEKILISCIQRWFDGCVDCDWHWHHHRLHRTRADSWDGNPKKCIAFNSFHEARLREPSRCDRLLVCQPANAWNRNIVFLHLKSINKVDDDGFYSTRTLCSNEMGMLDGREYEIATEIEGKIASNLLPEITKPIVDGRRSALSQPVVSFAVFRSPNGRRLRTLAVPCDSINRFACSFRSLRKTRRTFQHLRLDWNLFVENCY